MLNYSSSFKLKDEEIDERKISMKLLFLGDTNTGKTFIINSLHKNNKEKNDMDVDEEEKKNHWLKFNDSHISVFDINDIEKECFGGSTKGQMYSYENFQNAYMLIYERKKKTPLRFRYNENDLKNLNDSGKEQENIIKLDNENKAKIKKMYNLAKKDANIDEKILYQKIFVDENKKNEEEKEKKKLEFLKNREMNLQQIRDKKKAQEEAEKEYERDKKLVDDIVKKMIQEDIEAKKEDQRKKEINKLFMQNAYKERDLLKQKELENDKMQDEEIKKYNELVALREKNVAEKKNDLQKQKDKIFNKLCEEEAKRKAEQDYWDTVRSELHREQDLKKTKLKEKEEEEKRQKMKDDVIESALKQMQFKEQQKKREIFIL